MSLAEIMRNDAAIAAHPVHTVDGKGMIVKAMLEVDANIGQIEEYLSRLADRLHPVSRQLKKEPENQKQVTTSICEMSDKLNHYALRLHMIAIFLNEQLERLEL